MVEDEKWHQFIFLYLLKDDFNKLKLFDGERKILDNEKITMQWFNINELNKIVIKPNVLANLLVDMPKELIHVINTDK